MYASATSSGCPRIISRPLCIQRQSLHRSFIEPSEWLTRNIARAVSMISAILAWALTRNCASPADSASSISRMSGSMCTATENASRENMPEE